MMADAGERKREGVRNSGSGGGPVTCPIQARKIAMKNLYRERSFVEKELLEQRKVRFKERYGADAASMLAKIKRSPNQAYKNVTRQATEVVIGRRGGKMNA